VCRSYPQRSPACPNLQNLKSEIAASAAALVVEEGLEYGPAKRRALKQMGLPDRAELPGNDELEDAVREYIEIFWLGPSGWAQRPAFQTSISSCFVTTPNLPK
jgi:hypothetical protein